MRYGHGTDLLGCDELRNRQRRKKNGREERCAENKGYGWGQSGVEGYIPQKKEEVAPSDFRSEATIRALQSPKV